MSFFYFIGLGCKAPVALIMHRPQWNKDAHSAQEQMVAEAHS